MRFARILNGRHSWGRRLRRPPPSSATIRLPKTEAAARSESRFGSKSSRSRVRRRRSEFPACREFSFAPVGAPFQKDLQCHGVDGFTTHRLQAGSGAEQGISNDQNRSLSGAFATEQGKNRWAKTGRGADRGRVARRGQDSLPPTGEARPCQGSDESAPRRSCRNHLALVHRCLEASRWRPWPLASETLDHNRQDMIRILETLHEFPMTSTRQADRATSWRPPRIGRSAIAATYAASTPPGAPRS